MPTPDTGNVLVGVGFLYHAPEDTAEPTGVGSVPGPDGAAPTGFTYVGATEEGVSLNFEREINDHYIEESSIQALSTPGNSTFSIELQAAESTLANWKLGVGGGSISTNVLTLSDTLDKVALYIDMPAPGVDQRRTVYIPRATSVGGLAVALRRNESKQLITVNFRSACTLPEIKIADKPIT